MFALTHHTPSYPLRGVCEKGSAGRYPDIDFLQASSIVSLLSERVYTPGQATLWEKLHVSGTYLFLAPLKITVLLATVSVSQAEAAE
jgi:hypothetical protein